MATTEPERLKIASKSYSQLKDQPVFVTPELKARLKRVKLRRGGHAFEGLEKMGFRGGKHLFEIIRKELGAKTKIVLSHEKSRVQGNEVVIDYEQFRKRGQQRFFAVYRETGLQTAVAYLGEAFPSQFGNLATTGLPSNKDVKRVLTALPEAAEKISKTERAKLPDQIAELVERQGPDFVLKLLATLDGAISKGQERVRVALQEVVERLAKEPAKAMQELSDLMGEFNLLQLTSLVNVLKNRINTIETFGNLVQSDETYELKTDKSIHRTLEKSMWILDDSYWIAQSNKTLKTLIGKELEEHDKAYGKHRPDFACVDTAAGGTILVEIKRPALVLGKKEIDQAETYLRIVRKQKTKGKTTIYLIGRELSPEAKELADLRGYPKLLTYTDMITDCRQRYQEYLKIIEAES